MYDIQSSQKGDPIAPRERYRVKCQNPFGKERYSAMNTLPEVNLANKYEHHNYGYRLYMAGEPITRCTNDKQRRGWKDAQLGESACAVVDAVFTSGGNASDADYALTGAW
jgi:hypothetical protein